MMKGGLVPGGSWRNCAWLTEVICATAEATFTCGWKKTLMTATPARDCDSMCSMSLTVVVMARSLLDTMRWDICSDDRPAYPHTTVTIGISMSGKMSVGIVSILKMPRITIRSAKTTKV